MVRSFVSSFAAHVGRNQVCPLHTLIITHLTIEIRLRASWAASLNEAESSFRALSGAGNTWQRVPIPKRESSISASAPPTPISVREASDLAIHRKSAKRGDVYRIALDLEPEPTLANLDAWRAVLATPELRMEWDPAVESARLVELFDLETRISKTNFTLGWPAKCVARVRRVNVNGALTLPTPVHEMLLPYHERYATQTR